MTTTPRFNFRLPVGWEPRPRTATPVAGADFAALYGIADQGFTPNITVAGQHLPRGTDIALIADQTLTHIRSRHPDVQEVRRAALGTEAAPGIGQEVRFRLALAGNEVELTQVHVVIAAGPSDAADGQIVLKTAFTATSRQAPSLIPAFQQFIATLELEDAAR